MSKMAGCICPFCRERRSIMSSVEAEARARVDASLLPAYDEPEPKPPRRMSGRLARVWHWGMLALGRLTGGSR